jgi:serine protease Do
MLTAALMMAQAIAANARPDSFADLAEKISPAVVNITTSTTVAQNTGPTPLVPEGSPFEDFFRQFRDQEGQSAPRRSTALGSGFVISEDGYIVTNNHVIEAADEISIEFYEGGTLDAKVIGTDPKTDIALLKVEADHPLPFVSFGDSDTARVGDWVLAMGNPLGQGFSVSAGIVSARNRALSGTYDDYIQTDAAINRGNSGGPLFNTAGDVVGVNTAIVSPSGGSVGIGFAVPSAVAKRIVADLRNNGSVERGWLGVSIQPVSEDIADALGIDGTDGTLVASVTRDSPADKAGLKAGDVILKMNGVAVEGPRALSLAVADLAVGSDVPLTIRRDGKTEELSVRIGLHPRQAALASDNANGESAPDTAQLGVAIAPLDASLRARLNLPEDLNGIAITQVAPDSAAAEAGLRPGDIIISAAGSDVPDVESLRGAVAAAADEGTPLLLRVYRGGNYTFVAVKLADEDSKAG